MFRRGAILSTLLVLTQSLLASAQAPTCTLTTFATVVSRKDGSLVHGLEAKDFRARVGRRQAAAISSVRLERAGLGRVVLVVDASGSMSDRWLLATRVIEHFLSAISEEVPVGVVVDMQNELKHLAVGTSHSEMHEFIQQFTDLSGGRTHLYDALSLALSLLDPVRPGDAIYVISDGGDSRSRISSTAIESAVLRDKVRLFALIAMDPFRRLEGETVGRAVLELLSLHSGGQFFASTFAPSLLRDSGGGRHARHRDEFYGALNALYERMQTYYILEVEAPLRSAKSVNWSLEVVDARGQRRRDLEVTYPRRLPPCPARAD